MPPERQGHEDLTAAQTGADLIGGKRDFCPACRADLTDALRWHILECEAISAAIGERVESGRVLKKLSDELTTRSAILAAESQVRANRVLLRMRRTT